MEKSSRAHKFSLFLGALSCLLSIVTLVVCISQYRADQPNDPDPLAVSGEVKDDQETVSDQAPQPSKNPSPETEADGSKSPLIQAPPAAPIYTVRLVPTDDIASNIGIYDSAGALILQASLPLATLCPDDQAALRAGIEAENLESARQLVRDFCE
ncbi:MAG: hypothetical protein IIX15_02140 [Clostridia bacterium]|nr:hypothetical protein [Clostridia bacterium]